MTKRPTNFIGGGSGTTHADERQAVQETLLALDFAQPELESKSVHLWHPHWTDAVCLFPLGNFSRKSTGCKGTWALVEGNLELTWDEWGVEIFSPNREPAKATGEYRLTGMRDKPRKPLTVSPPLLHIGCGPNQLEGWQNLDLPNVDIRKPLEWPDDSMEGIFLEHVIEHVPPPDAFRFMREAFRVLKPGGVLRLAFPDTVRIYREATPDYLQFLLNSGYGDGSVESAVTSIILNHGHCGIWSEEVMCVVLATAGFDEITVCVPGDSEHAAMRGLEQHGKRIGERNNLVETCCVDAVKRKYHHTPVKSAGAW